MTILGVSDSDVGFASGLATGSEKIFKFTNAYNLDAPALTILAHSSDSWLTGQPSKIGGLSADRLAEAIAFRYAKNKAALEHVYLVSCEAGLWYEGKPPLAKAIAEALVRQGFNANVKVHAIASPIDHDISAGQSVTVASYTTGRTTIDAKTYATDELRKLEKKDAGELTREELRLWKD